MENIDNLGKILKDKRIEKNISFKDIGIEEKVIKILEGNQNIDNALYFMNIYKYCDFLEVDISNYIKEIRKEMNINEAQEIGIILKWLREKENLSIENIALKLKINKRMITKIEDGDILELSSFYRKNYLKKYSQIFNFSLMPYDDFLSITDTIEIKTKISYEKKKDSKPNHNDFNDKLKNKPQNKNFSIIIGSVIIIGLIIGVVIFTSSQSKVLNPDGPFHQQFRTPVENKVSVEPVEETMEITDVTDPNNYEVSQTLEISGADPVTISINFTSDCYVQITGLSEEISQTYYTGDNLTFDLISGDDVVVQFGNVYGVDITVNDQSLSLAEGLETVSYIEFKVV